MSRHRVPFRRDKAFERFSLTAILVVVSLFLVPIAHCQTCVTNSQVTLAGTLRGANGIASSNYVFTMAPTQQGYIAGCGVNLPTSFQCATSTDGSVVGVVNPLTATVNTASGGGTLPAGVYYTVYEFYDAAGNETLPSPETRTTLSVTESLVVNPPASGIPSTAVGMKVFIGTSSGGETLQGTTTGSSSYVQSVPLTSGAAPASTNSTLCKVTANDSVWPVGTGYNVSLVDSQGNNVPQYPMQWQLLGAGTTYDLSYGLPYYHGVVFYPSPILSQPANHGMQSISGPLSLGGYNLVSLGRVGVGTGTPGYGVDVEGAGINGVVNAAVGYLFNGGAGSSGQALCSDGTYLDAFCSFVPASTTFYYQTVQSNAVDQTQRLNLNFSPQFALSDSSSPSTTTVDLATTGISPGACNEPNSITYDAYGRASACTSSGSTTPVSTTCNSNGCYKVGADGTITAWGLSSLVTGTPESASLTITYPTTFTDVTTPRFNLQVAGISDAPGDGNPHALDCHVVRSSMTTTGATAVISWATAGGSGYSSLATGDYCFWMATGH